MWPSGGDGRYRPVPAKELPRQGREQDKSISSERKNAGKQSHHRIKLSEKYSLTYHTGPQPEQFNGRALAKQGR